tara:strand:+ start:1184 stop:2065 length:882 start_codon:yes stop_codon:yes gene_type:complete
MTTVTREGDLLLTRDRPISPLAKQLVADIQRGGFNDTLALWGCLPGQCLLDLPRTYDLLSIIEATTEKGGTAVDLGAGTGVLGFGYLAFGGGFVYMVEQNEAMVGLLKQKAEELGFADRVEIIEDDVRTIELPGPVDYVLAELVSTGLLREPLISAAQNIRAEAKDALYLPTDAYLGAELLNRSGMPLTEVQRYAHVHIPTEDALHVDSIVRFFLPLGGTPEFLRLHTSLGHPDGTISGLYETLCSPLELVLSWKDKAQLQFDPLHAGQDIPVHLAYPFGGDSQDVVAEIIDT